MSNFQKLREFHEKFEMDIRNEPYMKLFENKKLQHYVKITGKKKMDMKIDTYQNDGFWFSTPEGEGDIRWRLWVGADKLLNPPVKSKVLKQTKEEEQ